MRWMCTETWPNLPSQAMYKAPPSPVCASHYKDFWPCLVCWDLCNAVQLNHFSSGIILNKYFHSHWSRLYFNYKYPLNPDHTGEKLFFLVILSFFTFHSAKCFLTAVSTWSLLAISILIEMKALMAVTSALVGAGCIISALWMAECLITSK